MLCRHSLACLRSLVCLRSSLNAVHGILMLIWRVHATLHLQRHNIKIGQGRLCGHDSQVWADWSGWCEAFAGCFGA